ncbi:hypothetical protein FAGKG844_350063 [Frankia sp. AgKG'84/4]
MRKTGDGRTARVVSNVGTFGEDRAGQIELARSAPSLPTARWASTTLWSWSKAANRCRPTVPPSREPRSLLPSTATRCPSAAAGRRDAFADRPQGDNMPRRRPRADPRAVSRALPTRTAGVDLHDPPARYGSLLSEGTQRNLIRRLNVRALDDVPFVQSVDHLPPPPPPVTHTYSVPSQSGRIHREDRSCLIAVRASSPAQVRSHSRLPWPH